MDIILTVFTYKRYYQKSFKVKKNMENKVTECSSVGGHFIKIKRS